MRFPLLLDARAFDQKADRSHATRTWPNSARVALWVNPNVEFFGLDDVMPSNLNDRVPRDQAKIPNVYAKILGSNAR